MAHFAQIENNIVMQVVKVNNEVITDENGVEQEALGVSFLKSLYGEDTDWKQTSYNNNIRGIYAGIGMTYNPDLDEFKAPVVEEVTE